MEPIDARVSEAVDRLARRFPEWDRIHHEYVRDYGALVGRIEREPQNESAIALGKLLCELLISLPTIGGITDRWTGLSYCPNCVGTHAEVQSEHLEAKFRLGMAVTEGFWLDMEFVMPTQLARVDDDFWTLLLSLNDFGRVRYQPCICPQTLVDEEVMRVLMRSESAVFQLCMWYTLSALEGSLDVLDLGDIRVMWSRETPWPELIRGAVECFRRMHRMNELLRSVNRGSKERH